MNREQWLMRAVVKARPLFKRSGFEVPANIRVSCGLPSVRAFGKRRAVGECWAAMATRDRKVEIYVSPTIDDGTEVLGTLLHELVHAVVGVDKGHGTAFKRCASLVGLEGKPRECGAGKALKPWVVSVVKALGAYPHGRLDKFTNGRKKEGTRLLKAECPECGYTVRVTRKWVDVGLPTCCCGGGFVCEEGEADDE
jgi:hypothetical protein